MHSYSQPSAIFQFTGGYSMPVGSMRGTFGSTSSTFMVNNPDTNSYYMKMGYGYGLLLKKAFGNTTATISDKINITTVSIGAEWSFLPKNRHFCPFAGATFDANIFSGSLTSVLSGTSTSVLVSQTNTRNLLSQLRFGISFGGGIDFPIQQNVGAVIGTKYYITNILGKKFQTNDLLNYGLNDAAHTINNVNTPARTIAFFQFYGGISFYFGK
jgi:opacity protein-like surface antigen